MCWMNNVWIIDSRHVLSRQTLEALFLLQHISNIDISSFAVSTPATWPARPTSCTGERVSDQAEIMMLENWFERVPFMWRWIHFWKFVRLHDLNMENWNVRCHGASKLWNWNYNWNMTIDVKCLKATVKSSAFRRGPRNFHTGWCAADPYYLKLYVIFILDFFFHIRLKITHIYRGLVHPNLPIGYTI